MTVYSKLFIAGIIVAAGFGVAKLIGEPAACLSQLQNGRPPVATPLAREASKPADSSLPAPYATRLVPDFSATNINAPPRATSGENPPPLFSSMANAAGVPAEQADAQSLGASNYSSNSPQAKLRIEAPRPVHIENRAPPLLRAFPPTATSNAATAVEPPPFSSSAGFPPATMIPAEFSQGVDAANATTASFMQSANEAPPSFVSPPPWSMPDNGPRTHIIVDGDSLAKLAQRYLDDPRRSNEIYELNRDLLASPELLPIGAELTLPARISTPSSYHESPSSAVQPPATIRAAKSGLVPVGPIPTSAGVMPRAQLIRPLPVE